MQLLNVHFTATSTERPDAAAVPVFNEQACDSTSRHQPTDAYR